MKCCSMATHNMCLYYKRCFHILSKHHACHEIHYIDVIRSAIASQITSLPILYPPVYSGADQRKHQSSASLAFVWGIHRWPVNTPHKGPVTRKCFYLRTSSYMHKFLLCYVLVWLYYCTGWICEIFTCVGDSFVTVTGDNSLIISCILNYRNAWNEKLPIDWHMCYWICI